MNQATQGYDQAKLLTLIALIDSSPQGSICQDLPQDEATLESMVDTLNDMCMKGSVRVGTKTTWPNGKPPEPPESFFTRVASCWDQTVANSSGKTLSRYAYFESSVLGTASSLYDDNTPGIKAFRLTQKSFEADPTYRPALDSFVDAVSVPVLNMNWFLRHAAAATLGTDFKTDLDELQTAVNALPANDPGKPQLLHTLQQVANVLNS